MRRKAVDVLSGAGGLAVVAVTGSLIAGMGAFAATNWTVEPNGAPRVEAQSATVSNLTISALVTRVATSVLYPGGNGDVDVTISNPNPYPVTVTAVSLPTDTTYATGYTTSALTTTKSDCLASSPSGVIWNYSTTTSGSSHILATALTVAASGQANNPLRVTFIDGASMTAAAPAACEGTYLSMPALAGVVATRGPTTVTTSPTTDRWKSDYVRTPGSAPASIVTQCGTFLPGMCTRWPDSSLTLTAAYVVSRVVPAGVVLKPPEGYVLPPQSSAVR